MRVKKFEAKSMKEALLMIKHELGPDAVILSAKDHRKSYGLVGEGSVEVTAAVSDSTLHKKKFVESRLTDTDRERFRGSSARDQKQLIEKMADRRINQQNQARTQLLQQAQDALKAATPAVKLAQAQHRPSQVSYIDIHDDVPTSQGELAGGFDTYSARSGGGGRTSGGQGQAQQRRVTPAQVQAHQAQLALVQGGTAQPAHNSQLAELRSEILRLHEVIQNFQKVPQSFAPAHPGAELGVDKDLSFMYQKLSEAGVNSEIITDLLRQAQAEIAPQHLSKRTAVDAWVAKRILDSTQLTQDPFKGRVHVFVGPSGSGKTSALIKMASHMVVTERKRIAIVSADTLKVGAVDQMKIYARILNVPFALVRNQQDWEWALSQLANVDHILVDSPGLLLKDLEEIHFLKSVLPPEAVAPISHLVLRSTFKDTDAFEMGRRYKSAGYQDVIFTNLDQSVQHGLIYNFQLKTGTPLHSFGIGSRIPEDFEAATKERVLDLIFKLTKLKSDNGRGNKEN